MANTDSIVKRHGQKIAILLFWVAVVVTYFIYSTRNNLGPLEVINQVVQTLQTSAWGPLLYILIYTLRPILLFSAVLLTVAGGLLFGPIWGWMYATIGANSGAMVAYSLGRVLGKGMLENSSNDTVLQKYADRMRQNSFDTILTMRFLFLPYDLVNYLAGFLRINWRAFLLASFLGSLPGSIAFILFGASLEGNVIEGTPSFNPWTLAASVGIFIISLILSRVFKRRETQQQEFQELPS
jgi:uncharacterized membrane protein YdjX (TVP38/TMEM64 family)